MGYEISPQLFIEDFKGQFLMTMNEVKRIEDGKLGELDCYRVQSIKGDTPYTLWIDKQTSLIHKIDRKQRSILSESSCSETTIIYHPTVNAKISDDTLKFNASQPQFLYCKIAASPIWRRCQTNFPCSSNRSLGHASNCGHCVAKTPTRSPWLPATASCGICRLLSCPMHRR